MDTKKFTSTLAGRLGRKPEDIDAVIKTLGELISGQVVEGNTVSIPAFGSFEPKMRAERETVHPASGRKILVPPKLSLVFKPSALLKQKVRKITP